MASAGVLEERDVGWRSAARDLTGGECVQIAEHVRFANRPIGYGLTDVADSIECSLMAIDEDPGAASGFVIGFAGHGGVAADQVQMRSELEADALYQRRVRSGAGADDVRLLGGCREVLNEVGV